MRLAEVRMNKNQEPEQEENKYICPGCHVEYQNNQGLSRHVACCQALIRKTIVNPEHRENAEKLLRDTKKILTSVRKHADSKILNI